MAIRAGGYLRKVLGRDEDVLMIVRQHGLFLLWRLLPWIVLAVVAFVGGAAVQMAGHGSPTAAFGYLLLAVPAIAMLWQYLVWSNHAHVLTSRRVIQMSGVFNKEVVDSLLEKLNDVKTEQSFAGRIFGWGDIEILTANEGGANLFHHIARPLEFKQAMLQAKEAMNASGIN